MLYHKALSSLNQGSSMASQTLRHALRVAKYFTTRSSSMQRAQDLELRVSHFDLPDWFPWLESSSANPVEQSPQSTFYQKATMQKLENAGHPKITATYGELIVKMCNTGRKHKRAKGRIAYRHIMQTWLRGDIISELFNPLHREKASLEE